MRESEGGEQKDVDRGGLTSMPFLPAQRDSGNVG